jgi:hypothetical protein
VREGYTARNHTTGGLEVSRLQQYISGLLRREVELEMELVPLPARRRREVDDVTANAYLV